MDKQIKEMITGFEDSNAYIKKLNSNLESFTVVFEAVKERLKPLDDIKYYLNDNTVITNLEKVSIKSKQISEDINKLIKDTDVYIENIKRMADNYNGNITETLDNLKSVESLIQKYNKDIAPIVTEIKRGVNKISSVDIENTAADYNSKLSEINTNISLLFSQFDKSLKNIEYKLTDYLEKINDSLKSYSSKISIGFAEISEKGGFYSEQIEELIKIHNSLNHSVKLIEENDQQPLEYFNKLCNIWAKENLRKNALKKNNNLLKIITWFFLTLLLLFSLFLNYDFYFNDSVYIKRILQNKTIHTVPEIK